MNRCRLHSGFSFSDSIQEVIKSLYTNAEIGIGGFFSTIFERYLWFYGESAIIFMYICEEWD